MRSTYKAVDAIHSLLVLAQDPDSDMPFVISPAYSIFDFQPGDFTVDGQKTEDGIYIFFDQTRFDPGKGSPLNQTHDPKISIDMYTSITSSQSASTGDIEFSVRRADRAIRGMSIEIYEALKHASFLRMLDEWLESNGVDSWCFGGLDIESVVKTGVLRLKHSKSTVAHLRMTVTPTVTEIHGTATGSPYGGTDDQILPVRVEEP